MITYFALSTKKRKQLLLHHRTHAIEPQKFEPIKGETPMWPQLSLTSRGADAILTMLRLSSKMDYIKAGAQAGIINVPAALVFRGLLETLTVRSRLPSETKKM